MSFFSLLLAFLLEQARPLPRGNVAHATLRRWLRWAARKFDAGTDADVAHSPWLTWGLAMLVPTLVAWLVYLWLSAFGWIGWALALLWNVAVLYITLGFRQFSFRFTAIRDALESGDEQEARRLLAEWQQIDASELPKTDLLRAVLEFSVLAAHRHVFGVMFWFVLGSLLGFGPAGAVFYRLSELVTRYWPHVSRRQSPWVSEAVLAVAARAWGYVDWLPARLTALGFAMVGRFEDVVDAWRRHAEFRRARQKNADAEDAASDANAGKALSKNLENDGLILMAVAAALNVRLGATESAQQTPVAQGERADWQEPQLAHLRSSVGLIWRCVVLWMFLLAVLTIGRWLA